MISAKLPGHKFSKISKDYANRLKGIVRCGKCGSYFVSTIAHGHGDKLFYYYECSRARQKLGCDAKRISATAFDEAVIDFFRRASEDQDILVKCMISAVKDSTAKLNNYEKEIKVIERNLKKAKKAAEEAVPAAGEAGAVKPDAPAAPAAKGAKGAAPAKGKK